MTKTRVVILFGGRSAEHEVSILSARNVVAALDRDRFEPVLVGVDRAGQWRLESERTLAGATGDPRALALDPAAPAVGVEAALIHGPTADGAAVDTVVFPVLHGTFGEDGTVQGLLDLADVAYVGAGVLGSAVGMDKDVAKRLLRDAGHPDRRLRAGHGRGVRARRGGGGGAGGQFGFPVFVKPSNAGSSVGVTRVRDRAGLAPAVRAALQFDRKVLIERAVDAREIECAVLGNDEPVASVPSEILVHHPDGFYSYQAKYVDADGASFRIPADIPAALTARVQALAVQTFQALELAGMARVDFFLERGGAAPALYVNEVNTIPGFTAQSMYPKMWEASGVPPKALLTRLVELALERWTARRALKTGV